jgi:hypothetical protein
MRSARCCSASTLYPRPSPFPPIHGWLIWPDELYTFLSVLTLAAFAVILWWFGRARPARVPP